MTKLNRRLNRNSSFFVQFICATGLRNKICIMRSMRFLIVSENVKQLWKLIQPTTNWEWIINIIRVIPSHISQDPLNGPIWVSLHLMGRAGRGWVVRMLENLLKTTADISWLQQCWAHVNMEWGKKILGHISHQTDLFT